LRIKAQLKAAMEEYERLSRDVFPKLKGLCMGGCRAKKKYDVMQRFTGENEVQSSWVKPRR